MKTRLLALLFTMALACAKDRGNGPTGPLAAVAGRWQVTTWEIVVADDPSRRLDLVAEGRTATLRIRNDGTFTLVVREPGAGRAEENGLLVILEEGLLLLDGEADEVVYAYSQSAGVFVLQATEPELFDVDGDGTPESTLATITLQPA
ncbi:MAG TPA: hypothetical protein VIC56_04305 [Gemmatimonadota bacterium]